MPTTNSKNEQNPQTHAVSNGSALSTDACLLSVPLVGTENCVSSTNSNGNGVLENDRATEVFAQNASGTSHRSPQVKFQLPGTCDSEVSNKKFLGGVNIANGDFGSDTAENKHDSSSSSFHNHMPDSEISNGSYEKTSALSDSQSGSPGKHKPTSTLSPHHNLGSSECYDISSQTQVFGSHSDSSSDTFRCIDTSDNNKTCDSSLEDKDSPIEGACSANPTLWLGDDQMLLLPGKGRSEETDSNSGTSETKSFEGLLSPNGTSILWDEDTDWILLFDNMIRYADRKQQRTTRSCGCRGTRTDDETDSKSQHSESSEADGSSISKSVSKRASSAPPARRGIFTSSKSLPTTTTPKRKPSLKSATKPMSSGGGAGGADEEMFIKSFEDVPRLTLYSAKELETELTKIKDILGDPSNDWEKRVEMCKRVRSLLIAGGHEYDEFYPYLRQLELPFQNCVKDLRSQVVREACITIAYLSQQLGTKLDHFAETLLPSLINLIPNSAKIMSTAGIVAIRFIIRYTHVSRLIPIITSHLSSKSKDIRKTCFEFLDQLLVTWPTHPMEKHVGILTDAIRKGISDADPEARAFSRKAFWSFADHFREQADSLLNSLDNSKQRMLHDELTMSNSSSSSSLTQSGKPYRSTVSNHAGSVENLSLGRTGTLGRRTGISNLPNSKTDASSGIPTRLRSTSAIDLSAVRRAKARAAYSTVANLTRGSGASLLCARNPARRNESSVHAITSPERVIKSRPRGSSQSQPSSRPDSPSSRLSYATYSTTDGKGRTRNKSGIPIATSREASPTRSGYAHERRLSGSRMKLIGAGEKYPSLPSTAVPLMAERTLQQSREAEVAVADALRAPTRRRYNAFDDQSDESETSSVCSDRSFSSFGRSVDDISEVIHNLHSIHWSDRKEGLQALQAYLRSGRMLSTIELKKVTDIFSKIFMDPHTKMLVFSLFLDALDELIVIHKNDLHSWLYVLLTRLFLKMGGDILSSVLAKIQKTLELVKESFPYENQFAAIVKFLNDQTQTPNTKVKIALLKYLHSLISDMDPSKFSSANTEVRFAFMKVISWTAMHKSSDLRKYGEDVLVALFSLNPAEYSTFIDQLPKAYKDSAFQLLHSRYPRSNSETPRSVGNRTSPCPVMSHLQSPNSPWPRSHSGTPQNRSFEYDDTENLNPEEISNSWKKTMSEIEEYKSDDYYDKFSDKIIRESPSRSISSRHNSLDGRFDNLVDRLELDSSADSSPTKRSPSDYGSINFSRTEGILYEKETSETPSEADNEIDDHRTIYSIVDELNQSSRNEKKIHALGRLISLAKEQSSIISNEDFRKILLEVIQTVEDTSVSVKTLALKALRELIKTKADYFQDYIELTLLRILEAHKDTDNDVTKIAEMCSAVAAVNLPPDQCARTLKALILTGQMPLNQAAIKMLTKLVEHHPKQTVLNLLPEIMPALKKAYDNNESPVRKAAVFCMVAIHCKVGEAMQPHLVNLNSCQMKLLNIYIKKAQTQNTGNGSAPGSPGNPPSSSSSH
ncbi:CLIP-associating protein 2-like isoform X4 [Stegodyphus dumicola]|uniref:CLIP-associating protein 2-like isoform X4 n=1 Tax=Stegodyphus dumicola TaxID=202533 RepID=UPI0015AE2D6A|nr:CLIP-associating protein 2-like isoform X4 [Stegodyphus dumicola]